MKPLVLLLTFIMLKSSLFSQPQNKKSFIGSQPANYEIKQAIEFESLFPLFMTGGFHLAACYRYEEFRFRVSVINGGHYDAESAGLNNSSNDFIRHYETSPGFFFGYNFWKNIETYTYLEFHTFEIEQKRTGNRQDLSSTDFGGGISYQFFIGQSLYIQPGMHIYLRSDNKLWRTSLQHFKHLYSSSYPHWIPLWETVLATMHMC